MRVIEVDFEKCSGGCPMLPCRDIVKDGIVIIKVKGVEPPTDEELAQAFHEALKVWHHDDEDRWYTTFAGKEETPLDALRQIAETATPWTGPIPLPEAEKPLPDWYVPSSAGEPDEGW